MGTADVLHGKTVVAVMPAWQRGGDAGDDRIAVVARALGLETIVQSARPRVPVER